MSGTAKRLRGACATCGHPRGKHETNHAGDRKHCRVQVANDPTGAGCCSCLGYQSATDAKRAKKITTPDPSPSTPATGSREPAGATSAPLGAVADPLPAAAPAPLVVTDNSLIAALQTDGVLSLAGGHLLFRSSPAPSGASPPSHMRGLVSVRPSTVDEAESHAPPEAWVRGIFERAGELFARPSPEVADAIRRCEAAEARAAAEVGSPAWREARRSSIGSSEIAAVCGLDNPGNRAPLDIYMRKVGLADDDVDNAATSWGRRMEPVIRDWYAERTGYNVRVGDVVTHREYPWARATPDGFVVSGGEGFLLEIKAPLPWTWAEWGAAGTDEIAEAYLPQVTWQMGCAGVDRCDVAALIGQELRIYTVPLSERLWGALLERARAFWETHVVPRVPPPLDYGPSTRRYLAAKFPGDIRGLDPAPAGADALVREYIAFRNAEKVYATRKDETQTRICALIGEAAGFDLGDGSRVTWKRTSSNGTDWKGLAESLGATREAIEKFKRPGTRRFAVKLAGAKEEE